MGVKALRQGFSTGACAAAACAAAWRRGRGERLDAIGVIFPDGQIRTLPLAPLPPLPSEAPSAGAGRGADPNASLDAAPDTLPGAGYAAVIKDGGDDPDATHGAAIYARVRPARPDEATERDYLLTAGGATLVLRAVEGIGLCTRPGLDCDPGKWAINVVPRRMIAENLRLAGMDAGAWLAEIGVERGAELALRTLNSRLGVIGGLSILGTSGIVRPYSHEAYAATIRLCVRALREEGGEEAVFCTGGRTRAGARRLLPDLPETAFISIGDYIAVALGAAGGLRRITVACMPGKLCKYAAGLENTHARRADQDLRLLRREAAAALAATGAAGSAKASPPGSPEPPGSAEAKSLEDAGKPGEAGTGNGAANEGAVLPEAFAACASVREALPLLPAAARAELLRRLADAALAHFRRLHAGATPPGTGGDRPGGRLRLLVFDVTGTLLLDVSDGIS